ncbi:sprT-like domain-containing protein Spartan [Copidosoma floridanum]|uniref:sprT-like domain-containing protein Spartan n=1 Tax=Copidosoma floridanum TaxID=29053 RepID=UPI0006C96021|nr:sprT-like domain-containing protein Spartan [Copidosoma floridanum]
MSYWYDRKVAINLDKQLNDIKTREDAAVAKNLQNQLNHLGITENAVIPQEKINYQPKSLIDKTLEYIDPTPNVFTLFVQFNEKFFWNALLSVEVKWSKKMTSCAGTCTFHPRNKECVIALSEPLLKLRPRKDLIETLLHEMIHAYLFVTNNNKDRDGHGPVFQSHMNRINGEAGTHITIYHDFHEEVKLYQQHWWRCNGPCQKRPPYFGIVRRAMNRAPGPNDFWWAEHQLTCGGQYTKIKEPEKLEKTKKIPGNNSVNIMKPPEKNGVLSWLEKNSDKDRNSGENQPPKPSSNEKPRFSFSGVLGGSGTGKSILLDKFSNNIQVKTTSKAPPNKPSTTKTSLPIILNSSNEESHPQNDAATTTVSCPNCSKFVDQATINDHLDMCLLNVSINSKAIPSTSLNVSNEPIAVPSTSGNKRKSENDYCIPSKKSKSNSDSNEVTCPLCDKKIVADKFNDHLDLCLHNKSENKTGNDDVILLDECNSSSVNLHDSPHLCLICNKKLKPNETLNDHLEECVASVFDDKDDDDVIELETSKTDKPEVLDQYPCPVCSKLVKESLMNEHLDTCVVK